MAAVELGPRILDFSKFKDFQSLKSLLPVSFDKSNLHNMMLACGDGIKDSEKGICDIQFYTELKEQEWPTIDIFCCSYNYESNLQANIKYMESRPELDIILCLFNLENEHECNLFSKLFEDSIDNIWTDDFRFILHPFNAHQVTKLNGYIHNIDIRKKRDSFLDYFKVGFLYSNYSGLNLVVKIIPEIISDKVNPFIGASVSNTYQKVEVLETIRHIQEERNETTTEEKFNNIIIKDRIVKNTNKYLKYKNKYLNLLNTIRYN